MAERRPPARRPRLGLMQRRRAGGRRSGGSVKTRPMLGGTLQQFYDGLLLCNRVNRSALVLFLFEFPIGKFTVGGFDTFPDQLAVSPGNRIISPSGSVAIEIL